MNNSQQKIKDNIALLNTQFAGASAEDLLNHFLSEYQSAAALATSLGAEDQVLTDMICKIDSSARIFTLDTGRLPQETYSTIENTNKRYGISIQVFFPDFQQVETMTTEHGPNCFMIVLKNVKNAASYVRSSRLKEL